MYCSQSVGIINVQVLVKKKTNDKSSLLAITQNYKGVFQEPKDTNNA